ncbi:MAG: chlorite dismutase family protein, partial [Gemmatimonadetes bacterium]|nr:chlorite dismutase family protein [Gemmatimonadota bacterium]
MARPQPAERRQVVRYAFYHLDPTWRRLPAADQAAHKAEFAATIEGFAARMLLRTYSLVGVRGDADVLLWQVAEGVDTLQALQAALNRTRLGAHLAVPYSYLAMTRRSIYVSPEEPGGAADRTLVRPGDAQYLFVYPFVKTRAWYRLSKAARQGMMDEHIAVGRKYP